MENRNGLAVAGAVTHATGTSEREAATQPSADLGEGATLGADKGYDAEEFVGGLKERKIVPHVTINGSVSKTGKVRKTAAPPQVATSPGYAASLRCRTLIEEIFGWIKTTGGFPQLKVRGLDATMTVRNTGPRSGATVAQLYLVSRDGKPKQRLVGFQRVELAAGSNIHAGI